MLQEHPTILVPLSYVACMVVHESETEIFGVELPTVEPPEVVLPSSKPYAGGYPNDCKLVRIHRPTDALKELLVTPLVVTPSARETIEAKRKGMAEIREIVITNKPPSTIYAAPAPIYTVPTPRAEEEL